jgi:hypothetical protein
VHDCAGAQGCGSLARTYDPAGIAVTGHLIHIDRRSHSRVHSGFVNNLYLAKTSYIHKMNDLAP